MAKTKSPSMSDVPLEPEKEKMLVDPTPEEGPPPSSVKFEYSPVQNFTKSTVPSMGRVAYDEFCRQFKETKLDFDEAKWNAVGNAVFRHSHSSAS